MIITNKIEIPYSYFGNQLFDPIQYEFIHKFRCRQFKVKFQKKELSILKNPDFPGKSEHPGKNPDF